jgi:hypothetical protein
MPKGTASAHDGLPQVTYLLCHTSHVTRHTSHVTRITHHTSHITHHTSHVTLHASHISQLVQTDGATCFLWHSPDDCCRFHPGILFFFEINGDSFLSFMSFVRNKKMVESKQKEKSTKTCEPPPMLELRQSTS